MGAAFHSALSQNVIRGAVTGIISAAAVDLAAFRSWKTWHDVATYDWRIASWRWFQGAVMGGLTGAGYGGMFG